MKKAQSVWLLAQQDELLVDSVGHRFKTPMQDGGLPLCPGFTDHHPGALVHLQKSAFVGDRIIHPHRSPSHPKRFLTRLSGVLA